MSEGSNNKFTRRTFLKLAGMTAAATTLGTLLATDTKDPLEHVEPNLDGLRKLNEKLYNSKNPEETRLALANIATLINKNNFELPDGYRVTFNCLLQDKKDPLTNFTTLEFELDSNGKKTGKYSNSNQPRAQVFDNGLTRYISQINPEDLRDVGVAIISPFKDYHQPVPEFLSLPSTEIDSYNLRDATSVLNYEQLSPSRFITYNFFSNSHLVYSLNANIHLHFISTYNAARRDDLNTTPTRLTKEQFESLIPPQK